MKQPPAVIHRPEFWEEQWEELCAAETDFANCKSAAVWNAMAAQYGRNSDPGDVDECTDATLDRLEKGGAVFENATVLDVGCGPGRYAAEFALRGARVVAVDISEKMIARLRSEISPGLLERISPIIADWKTLDIERHGFAKTFDLVFANMTPAIATPASFTKLMRASKQRCWYRSWAGLRENPLLERIRRALDGKEPRRFRGNFLYAWNLACASGYFPDCSFETVRWTQKRTLEEWSDFFTVFFSEGDSAHEAAIRHVIEASLREIAVDGIVENTVSGRTGAMLWSINR